MILSSWKLVYQKNVYQAEAVTPEEVQQKISKDQYSAYTTIRTFNRFYVYRLTEHFSRLVKSAEIMERQSALDEEALRLTLQRIMMQNPEMPDYRVRIYFIFDEPYGTIYIQVHDLIPPSREDYQQGVKCVTRTMQRVSPKAKLTQFMAKADRVRSEFPAGIHEAIMVTEKGEFLEGISSNFYAVMDGKVWTAEHGVLGGIVRGLTLELMTKEQIPYQLMPANVRQLYKIQEAFITSSSRGILPVVEIDGERIGDGKPGVITRCLMTAYNEKLLEELEPILPA